MRLMMHGGISLLCHNSFERKKKRKKSATRACHFLIQTSLCDAPLHAESDLQVRSRLSVADDVFLVLLIFEPVLLLLGRWSSFRSRVADWVLTGLSDHLEAMTLGLFIDSRVAVDIIQTIIPKASIGCPFFVRRLGRSENTDGLFELVAFDHALCVLRDCSIRLFGIGTTVV